jgi:RNA polymerase sigma factor for flagellar operon FliA
MRNRAAPAAPLPEEAVRQLWTQFAQSRAPKLRVRLIERYLRLAHVAAAKFYRQRPDNAVSFSDYLQYARLGLVEAIDGFDPSREASFETYSSYRIRGAMLNGLARESEIAAQRTFWRTRLEERVDLLGAVPTSEGEAELEELARMLSRLGGGSVPEWADEDMIDETLNANPYAAAELAQLREAVEKLPGREKQLIRRHYFDHCEFRVIAVELTVSPGRVSQLHTQALLRIREWMDGGTEPVPPRSD